VAHSAGVEHAPPCGMPVLVGVAVGVLVGVSVTVGVLVGVLVGVFVGVLVGVAVGVLVGVFVGVLVGVAVGVLVGVFVGVLVGGVLVGVLDGGGGSQGPDPVCVWTHPLLLPQLSARPVQFAAASEQLRTVPLISDEVQVAEQLAQVSGAKTVQPITTDAPTHTQHIPCATDVVSNVLMAT